MKSNVHVAILFVFIYLDITVNLVSFDLKKGCSFLKEGRNVLSAHCGLSDEDKELARSRISSYS